MIELFNNININLKQNKYVFRLNLTKKKIILIKLLIKINVIKFVKKNKNNSSTVFLKKNNNLKFILHSKKKKKIFFCLNKLKNIKNSTLISTDFGILNSFESIYYKKGGLMLVSLLFFN